MSEELTDGAIIGVSDHAGWAVLVTIAANGMVLDSRRVELVDAHLPPLPATVAERIQNYRAMCIADWVMYRLAFVDAAETRGWSVHWYDAKTVLPAVCEALRVKDVETYFLQARKSFGPPWGKDHKVATAAAISSRLPRCSPSSPRD